jgi:hypothetical protein
VIIRVGLACYQVGAMPRRKPGSRMEEDNDTEFIYVPSSSSEEDWGDGVWEVNGIEDEHTNTRGELRCVVS